MISKKSEMEKLEEKAANIIEKSIVKLAAKQKKIIVAIPGGRSVSGIFKILKNKKLPWDKVHIFMIDERLVTIDNKESNFLLAKKSFIDHLVNKKNMPIENIHPFHLKDSNDYGIGNYKEELLEHGGNFDIVLLSSGEDGHIGALYPNHESIDNNNDYFLYMTDSPKPPSNRMTSSKRLLLKSKVAVLLFFGEAKKEALKKFYDEDFTFQECPAKLVQDIPENYIFSDIKI